MSNRTKLYFGLSILIMAALACGIPTPAPEEVTDTPEPIIPTDTPSGPCTLHTDNAVTAYKRPSHSAEVFFDFGAGEEQLVSGTTADSWLGFDPGIAQAANIGPFRLRWVDANDGVSTTGDCSGVPELWGPPPGICFTMPMGNTDVYTTTDTTSPVLATLVIEQFAAVLGKTADNAWAQVDLGPGNTGLTDVGWVEGATLNMNGSSCASLPVVAP